MKETPDAIIPSPPPPDAAVNDRYWRLPIAFACLLAVYFYCKVDPKILSSLDYGDRPLWWLKANLAFCGGVGILIGAASQSLGYVVFTLPPLVALARRIHIRKAIASAGIFRSILLAALLLFASIAGFSLFLDHLYAASGEMAYNSPFLNLIMVIIMYLVGFLVFSQIAATVLDTLAQRFLRKPESLFPGIIGVLLLTLCMATAIVGVAIALYVSPPLYGQDFETGTGYDNTLSNLALFGIPYTALMATALGWYTKTLSRRAATTAISCAIIVLTGACLTPALGVGSAYCPANAGPVSFLPL